MLFLWFQHAFAQYLLKGECSIRNPVSKLVMPNIENLGIHFSIVAVCVTLFNCTPADDKYNRIVNKSWIQDSSHSLLTAYSFEFEDFVGKTLGEFLTMYPDSVLWDSAHEEPVLILKGWHFRYSDRFEVVAFFDYENRNKVVTRDSTSLIEWHLNEYLALKIKRFKVYDFKNENKIIPRKYDKLNRAPREPQ